jgi:hypothetical protein
VERTSEVLLEAAVRRAHLNGKGAARETRHHDGARRRRRARRGLAAPASARNRTKPPHTVATMSTFAAGRDRCARPREGSSGRPRGAEGAEARATTVRRLPRSRCCSRAHGRGGRSRYASLHQRGRAARHGPDEAVSRSSGEGALGVGVSEGSSRSAHRRAR